MFTQSIQGFRLCPLCYASEAFKLFELNYHLFDDCPLSEVMIVVACSQCGFVFYDTPSTEADFDEFYANHYFIHAYNRGISDYQSKSGYLKGISDFLLNGGVPQNAKVADVGCGQGQLLRALADEGFTDLTGVELCKEYVEQLIHDGFKAKVGSALDHSASEEKYDALIYKHIFEHFYDIAAAAKNASMNLHEGGFLFIAVPDASRYGEFEDYSFLHYMTLEHINHFDLYHVKLLMEQFGFSLVKHDSQMLDIAEDYPFPILTCLLQKNGAKPVSIPKKDFSLANKIAKWFARQRHLNSKNLQNIHKTTGHIYVWGISYRTAMYLAMSDLHMCNITAFVDIDKRKQDKTIKGKKIYSPQILDGCSPIDIIVIGVGPSSKKMEKLIREKGFQGTIIRLD